MTGPDTTAPPPAPLIEFAGEAPPAPAWFTVALANKPERSTINVDGAAIEMLTWGERGKPGLLFLHGNGAHADWWSFIAPYFAEDYRVAAFSWSGMGASDHRPTYSIEGFIREIFAVVDEVGLADTGPPLVVSHSFGGFPMMAAVHTQGERFAAAVIVDTPFRLLGEPGGPPPNATDRPHRVYPNLAAALARFRLAPAQGCANLYIADWIARSSLKEVDGGWTWRFDPFLWSRFEAGDTLALLECPRCPVALIWGENSMLMQPDRVAMMRKTLPPETPAISILDAEHHVMIDQPLAFVSALRGLFAVWPQPL